MWQNFSNNTRHHPNIYPPDLVETTLVSLHLRLRSLMAFVASPLPTQVNTAHSHSISSKHQSHTARRRRANVVRACAAPEPARETSRDTPPPPFTARDALRVWVANIAATYGGKTPDDGIPIAVGDVHDLVGDAPFFEALHRYYEGTGPVYKLAFGPKAFVVLQDPAAVRAVLKEGHVLYDKGVLAEVLEDIMGKGLIPADYETWRVRRRAIVPAFHTKWLDAMTNMFGTYTIRLCDKLAANAQNSSSGSANPEPVDMEAEFYSLALDIIGKAVFNYDFGSVENESPIVKAVYRVLMETEHRSTMFLPYWKIPGVSWVVPRQKRFQQDMYLINSALRKAINSVRESVEESSLAIEELEARDYAQSDDPSLLRFLVELRGERTTTKQLSDDMMTMLIAGHETSAALLTWSAYECARHPKIAAQGRAEVDAVLGDRIPTMEDIKKLSVIRRILTETLRLYPAPPLLIRRLLQDTTLPQGSAAAPMKLKRGTDLFINTYSLHRRPDLWPRADEFDPDRWLRKNDPGVSGWAGYNPAKGLEQGNPLYANEAHADFAFLPFGGGARKCVGDQFAILESVTALAMLIRRFDIQLADDKPVRITTGATMHTEGGLHMRMIPRNLNKTQKIPVPLTATTAPATSNVVVTAPAATVTAATSAATTATPNTPAITTTTASASASASTTTSSGFEGTESSITA